MLTAGTGLAALAAAAVHGLADPPPAVTVYADAVIVLSWIVAVLLLLGGHRSPEAPGDSAPGPRHHRAVRFSTDGEPVARSRWNSRRY